MKKACQRLWLVSGCTGHCRCPFLSTGHGQSVIHVHIENSLIGLQAISFNYSVLLGIDFKHLSNNYGDWGHLWNTLILSKCWTHVLEIAKNKNENTPF